MSPEERLKTIDERVLRRFASLHNYNSDAPKDDIVRCLAERDDVANLLNPATRLELKSFDSQLERKLLDQVSGKLADLDQKLKVVDEKQKVIEAHVRLAEEKVKAAEHPTRVIEARLSMLTMVALFLSVAGTGGAVFNYSRGAETNASLQSSSAMFQLHRQWLIESNLDEFDEFMNKFVISKPDPSLIARTERRLPILRRARAALPNDADADAAILSVLIHAYEGVQALRSLGEAEKTRMADLNNAERHWNQVRDELDTQKILVAPYAGSASKLKAYTENLLGIVYYRKAKLKGADDTSTQRAELLVRAKQKFESAVKEHPAFFPSYNNLVTVAMDEYSQQYRALGATETIPNDKRDALTSLLRGASDMVDKAIEYSDGQPKRSNVLNTSAYLRLLNSELESRLGHADEAKKWAGLAEQEVDRALNEFPVAPVALSTKAEIICQSWYSRATTRSAEDIASEFGRIVKAASDQGYRWYVRGKDDSSFYKQEGRFLDLCRTAFKDGGFEKAVEPVFGPSRKP